LSKLYTCDEIAGMYRVKKLTVWDWIRKKKLGAIKIGRDYRISQEQVDDFNESRKTAS
jgi:excisionase family DNA binding protein